MTDDTDTDDESTSEDELQDVIDSDDMVLTLDDEDGDEE